MSNEPGADDRLLTVREAAVILGLQQVTVRRLAATGRLPVVRPLGLRAVRFRLSDITRLTRGDTAPVAAPAPATEPSDDA